MTIKYMLSSLFIFILSACNGDEYSLPIEASYGIIYIKNMQYSKIKEKCLIKEVGNLLSDIDEGKIDPYKNKIFQEHTIVENIRKNKHLEVQRNKEHPNVLIPIDKKSLQMILFKDDYYALYGIENKYFQINLEKCLE